MKASGGVMLVPNKNGTRVFVIERGQGLVKTIETPGGGSSLINFSADGNFIYSVNIAERLVAFINVRMGTPLLWVRLNFDPARIIVDSATGNIVVTGVNGETLVLDANNGDRLSTGTITGAQGLEAQAGGGSLFTWKAGAASAAQNSLKTFEQEWTIDAGGGILDAAADGAGGRVYTLNESGLINAFNLSGEKLFSAQAPAGAETIEATAGGLAVVSAKGKKLTLLTGEGLSNSEEIATDGVIDSVGFDASTGEIAMVTAKTASAVQISEAAAQPTAGASETMNAAEAAQTEAASSQAVSAMSAPNAPAAQSAFIFAGPDAIYFFPGVGGGTFFPKVKVADVPYRVAGVGTADFN